MFLECFFSLIDPLKRNLNITQIMKERNIMGWTGGGVNWEEFDQFNRSSGGFVSCCGHLIRPILIELGLKYQKCSLTVKDGKTVLEDESIHDFDSSSACNDQFSFIIFNLLYLKNQSHQNENNSISIEG